MKFSHTPASVRMLAFGLLGWVLFLSTGVSADDQTDWREKMKPILPRGYLCRYTTAPIQVDGLLDEAAWTSTPWTGDFVNILGDAQPKPRFRTRAKLLWDDDYLYVA